MKKPYTISAFKIVVLYLAMGYVWIIFSDSFLNYVLEDADKITHLQITKGLAYVSITAILLFYLISIFKHEIEHKERQASAQLEKFKSIFESSMAGIFTLDSSQKIVSTNQSAEQLLGYKEIQLREKKILDIACICREKECKFASLEEIRKFEEVLFFKKVNGDCLPVEVAISEFQLNGDEKQYAVIFHDISERVDYEEMLKKSLKEKEIMLCEIHHRVKNNLAIISGLLMLQADRIEEKQRDAFYIGVQRVKSMALIHEILYQTENFAELDFAIYVKKLGESILKMYSGKSTSIAVNYDLEEKIFFDITNAIPAGLIISELVVNAIKHAFPGNKKGEINIRFTEVDESIIIEVSDNGVGMRDDIINHSTGLGISLIQGLAEQLLATLEIDTSAGSRITVRIPNTSKVTVA